MSIPSFRHRVGIVPLATAFVLFACLSIIGVEGWRTLHARALQLHEGETASANLARAMAQHAHDTLKQSDVVLLGLVDRVQADGIGPRSIQRIHGLMVRYTASMPQLQRLSIIGADGRWLTTSLPKNDATVDVSDREYFNHHRTSKDPASFFGPPIRSKSTNAWIVTLSRRIDREDGSFAGVVLASIDIEHFSKYFRTFDIGSEGALGLSTITGRLVDRRPYREDVIGSNIANSTLYRDFVQYANEGVVTLKSPIDGVVRQVAFQRLNEFPLYVTAALATSETLAGWKQDVITESVFILLLLMGIAFIGFRLVDQLKHRVKMEEQLRRSQAELESLNRVLSIVAREDALTGLANRRELDRVLGIETLRAQRGRAPLAFIMIDVDLFKPFNDRYGHSAGDDCLRRVGVALDACVGRPGDLAARYGGEEFCVVLPGVGSAGAAAVAERIRDAIRALEIPHVDSPKGIVTISAGLAVIEAHGKRIMAEALIRRADTALYAAKRNGRDTVEVYLPLLAA